MINDLQKVKGKYSFKEFVYTVIFCIVIAIFLSLVNFSENFVSSLIFSLAIGISISLTIHLMLYLLENRNPALKLFAVVSAVIIGTVLGVLIASPILGISLNYFFTEMKRFYYIMAPSLLFSAIISYIFISREIISTTKNELLEEKVKNVSTEKNLIETNLRLLYTQIEPHFLFNTLSTILSFIETDSQKGKVMMEDFINLLRSSLSTTREKTTILENEIDVIKSYLNIFKVRMGDRLNYKIDIPDEALKYHIPSMLIQPLVENAIGHGLEPKIDGGEILISGIVDGDKLKIEIADTGMGIDPKKTSNGVGIENVRKRLELLYEKNARLIIEENKPSGVKAILKIPYEPRPS